MIGYIRGTIAAVGEDCCFIETGGIGYRVYISDRDREALRAGQEEKLITHLSVREDALTLYGFRSQEAYELFLLLISISKIGPKVAMGILSTSTAEAFCRAIQTKDLTALTRLPGIGKKTAERLLLELKDKLGSLSGAAEDLSLPPVPAGALGAVEETLAALQTLGYAAEEVRPTVLALSADIAEPAALIRASLRELGKKKE